MLSFMEKLEQNVRENPDMAVVYDDTRKKGITYAELDHLTARVYGYLKSAGIGKEDFVLINLPRGIQPVIAMVGIWKAGAAFALVEDNYAPERIAYIREDCACKAELCSDNWDQVMSIEPLSGYEQTDPHDAAYAIYTSGTTGNPKGVLHEYGNLMECQASCNYQGVPFLKEGEIGAILAPLNFVASVMILIHALYQGGLRLYIVSYTTLKNPMLLMKFMLEKRISITFLTPSYVRMLAGKTGPFLKTLIVGSEPANHLYIKGVKLLNLYAMSESGFIISVFHIDKAYDTCPIGRPQFDLEYKLVKEDGEIAAPGETGQLVYKNEYVRGYLHLPEQTAESFRDGWYYTGDLAREDENGNLVLLGRANDMIKINGNRIEPAEIEAAVKSVLHLDWAAARGFEEEGQSFLCAYYKDDIQIDLEKTRNELLKRLPYYMLPAYFIKIDEVPLKATGKLDRKALPKPDTSDFQSDYIAPENEIQTKLCQAFASVLGLGRVGIHDDFYELGGDSLSAIQMIEECELPGLNASEIFRGRTPEKIAELYERLYAQNDGISPDEKNDASMKEEHLLTTEQLYMYDYQLREPKSTMYNLFSLMQVDTEQFDMEQVAQAMESAIRNHPALLTTYTFNDDGEVIQRYTPQVLYPIHVEHLTEWEFHNNVRDYLVQPFKMSDLRVPQKLHRCRVFQTEKAGYIFFDVHHSIFDGTSLKVFMENIGKSFIGMEMEKDYYYLMLKRREETVLSDFYQESKAYFESRYEGTEWEKYPTPDYSKGSPEEKKYANELGEIISELGVTSGELESVERANRISRNEFFITAAALSIAIYNKKNQIMMSWIYNGREDRELMSSVGLLFRELPVAVRFDDSVNIRDVYKDVHDQIQGGIEHSCYPYVDIIGEGTESEAAYLLYQQDIRDGAGLDGMEAIDIRQNQAATQTVLDIEILDGEDGLQVMLDYARDKYSDANMESYKTLFMKTVKIMVSHNSQEDITVGELKKEIRSNGSLFAKVRNIFKKKIF